MQIRYSKPSNDLKLEYEKMLNHTPLDWQYKATAKLATFPRREECVLCRNSLSGDFFTHRKIAMVKCDICGHIQTEHQPSSKYPGVAFNSQYAEQTKRTFEDRVKRIYKPKLDWAIQVLEGQPDVGDRWVDLRWVELGSGGGGFLGALQQRNVKHLVGLERDPELVRRANAILIDSPVQHYKGALSDAMDESVADIYTAFFVFEHMDDINDFFRNAGGLPTGTYMIFSVPVFGLSCYLENAFLRQFARHLDGTWHTQLFTDESIDYALQLGGLSRVATWIFGQDSMDFARLIMSEIQSHYPPNMVAAMTNDMLALLDPLQHAVDTVNLSDQRHIIVRKG